MISLRFNVPYRIEAGPSKWDLAAALFEHTREHPRLIEFTLIDRGTPDKEYVKLALNSIEREDGSGESWNLVGYYIGKGQLAGFCKIYFHTNRRSGTLTFLANHPQSGMTTGR